VHFRRIDELLELEGNADNFTNTREAAATLPNLSQYHQQELQIKSTSDPHTYDRQLLLCIRRMHREREQMRLFRRFRFQPTRAESELAMLPPLCGYLHRSLVRGENSKTKVGYEMAEEIYCQMLKSFEGNHDPKQPNILHGLNNLGAVLELYGKLVEAERTYLRILEEIGESVRPDDDIVLSLTLNNLAVVKSHQGKHQESEILLRRALNGREQRFGDWDWHVLCFCNNLAVSLRRQNKAREAWALQARVVERFRVLYGIGGIFNDLQKNLERIQG
jgi:tetratricopeptide (TPR) repeat protein